MDVTGFTPAVIKAGHVIIQDDNNPKDFKPMPLNGGATAYAALPANHTYRGVSRANALTAVPMVGIMTQGAVNTNCTPYPMASILAAFKTAVPLIEWRAD